MSVGDGEKRFRLLADNAPVLIWRSGLDRKCDFVNGPWLEFTGRALDSELGDGWADRLHPDDREMCVARYNEAFDRREPFSMRYRLQRADGVYRWLLDNGRPFFDEAGAFAGYFGSCTDVTDMMEAQQALAAADAEKAEILRQRDALLHEVHHRVRNNLQLILSILELQGRRADDAARSLLGVVAGRVRSIAAAQALVTDPTSAGEIDFTSYVSSLASNVSGVGVVGRTPVRVAGEPRQMDLGRAAPVGLALNELLSAASAVGPSHAAQAIDVAVRPMGEALTIDIAADLPPEAVEIALSDPTSLGWRLVERLVAQGGGRIERGEPPSLYRILLPPRPDPKRGH
jgi:PAS domain S-box-containing protein